MNLARLRCVPAKGIPSLLTLEKIEEMKNNLHPDWVLTHENKRLFRSIKTKDFIDAMKLANIFGEIAEEEEHHPELHVGYGHIEVEVWTHFIDGLSQNDFIFAAKSDKACRDFLY